MITKTIWKFGLIHNGNILEVPKDSEILDIQLQGDRCSIWFLVNPENEKEPRSFEVYGTGDSMAYDNGVDRKYISTIQDGYFVWHIFEKISV